MREKTSWFLVIEDIHGVRGIGEAGPLPGLSIDDVSLFPLMLADLSAQIKKEKLPATAADCLDLARRLVPEHFPSLRFALETALLDLFWGGKKEIIPNSFYSDEMPLPINGLIWMGDEQFMRTQFEKKLKEGFSCFKMKIGALDFSRELEVLAYIRSATKAILRVDANGAFDSENVFKRLESLSVFNLHSIEQPVKAGDRALMNKVCISSPVPVALDEELIGVPVETQGRRLLEEIQPAYIILKPTLVGGISVTRKWIELANELGIGWWMTSALESNIGLNAICQLTASLDYNGHQGLGTGMLYSNNIDSPLVVSGGEIMYKKENSWNLSIFSS